MWTVVTFYTWFKEYNINVNFVVYFEMEVSHSTLNLFIAKKCCLVEGFDQGASR